METRDSRLKAASLAAVPGLLLGLVLVLAVVSGPATAQDSLVTAPLAWTRIQEPVILTGSQLPAFDGAALDDLYVYAYQGGAWQPIPFQFDERIEVSGAYTVEDGLLDGDDELVLMAMDLGEQASAEDWIADADSQNHARYQVLVTDPLSPAEPGWAYVYHSTTLSPPPSLDYVNWNAGSSRVTALSYTLGFSPTIHAGVDLLDLNNSGVDALDRTKLRANITCYFLGIPTTMTLDEEDMAGQLDMTPDIDGPVRVGSGDAGGHWWFYAALYRSSTTLGLDDVTVEPCTSIKVNWIRLSNDWLSPTATGMAPATYYDSNLSPGVPVDGTPDAVPETPPAGWMQVSGALGSVVQVANVALDGGTMTNYYKDDQTFDPADTGQDGRSFGDAGFRVDQPPGQAGVELLTFILGPNQPNVGAIYLDYYDHPLQVRATAQTQPDHRVYLPLVIKNGP